MKKNVHNKLATLLCTEAAQQTGSPPVSHNTIVKTEDAPTLTVKSNAAVNKNEIKQMIKEALQDVPYSNTQSKRQKNEDGVRCKISFDKIIKSVA